MAHHERSHHYLVAAAKALLVVVCCVGRGAAAADASAIVSSLPQGDNLHLKDSRLLTPAKSSNDKVVPLPTSPASSAPRYRGSSAPQYNTDVEGASGFTARTAVPSTVGPLQCRVATTTEVEEAEEGSAGATKSDVYRGQILNVENPYSAPFLHTKQQTAPAGYWILPLKSHKLDDAWRSTARRKKQQKLRNGGASSFPLTHLRLHSADVLQQQQSTQLHRQSLDVHHGEEEQHAKPLAGQNNTDITQIYHLLTQQFQPGVDTRTINSRAVASAAVEEEVGEEEGRYAAQPPRSKKDVLFHSTAALPLRVNSRGKLLCLQGDVYGFATAAGPLQQQPQEGGSAALQKPRVRLQTGPSTAVLKIGGAHSTDAPSEPLSAPFASSVSSEAAAAASQNGSKVVLLCTAPGQPVVALPIGDVQIIHRQVPQKIKEDLEARMELIQYAATCRRRMRDFDFAQRFARMCMWLVAGACAVAYFGVMSRLMEYAKIRQHYIADTAENNPASLSNFIYREHVLRELVWDLDVPESFVDDLQSNVPTLPELRQVRAQLQLVFNTIGCLGSSIFVYLFVAAGATLFRKHNKRVQLKRKLILQGAPPSQLPELVKREEEEEEGKEVEKNGAADGNRTFTQMDDTAETYVAGVSVTHGHQQEYPLQDSASWWHQKQRRGRFAPATFSNALGRRNSEAEVSANVTEDRPPTAAAAVAGKAAYALAHEDNAFVAALRDRMSHWNSAAYLRPGQLENYSVVLVLPNHHKAPGTSPTKDTQLLIVHDARPQRAEDRLNSHQPLSFVPEERQQQVLLFGVADEESLDKEDWL